jgi:cation diffusion facilitator family transporter
MAPCTHQHAFDNGNAVAERSTWVVTWITAVTMVVEIGAGWWFHSMALLADGWHMGSHVLALGLSAMAYATARRYAQDPRFAFGTWKIEMLGGFASALFMLGVAVMMVVASVERLLSPHAIQYPQAIGVAVLGLLVNVVCALILGKAHHHGHGHGHGHGHDHEHHHHAHAKASQHQDLNLKSAYLHVLADAATSVLAIVALLGGWMAGWTWLDPLMGLVGAVLVALWAKGLIADTAKVLLDREMDHPVVDEVRQAVEDGPDAGQTQLIDLHVWRVGRQSYACAMTVVTRDPDLTPETLRQRLLVHPEIVHSTIEVQRECLAQKAIR